MTARKSFEPLTLFYHVTHVENVESIERDGLRADEAGDIYAFTDLLVADTIAANQVFADPYALFQIGSNGIDGSVFVDDVGELSSPLHCVIQQDRIDPKHLRYLGTMGVQQNTLTPWLWMFYTNMGLSRSKIEAMFGQDGQAGKGVRHG